MRKFFESMVLISFPKPVGGGLGVIAETLLAVALGFLGPLVSADIAEVHDEGAHARLSEQIGYGTLRPQPRPMFMENAKVAGEDGAVPRFGPTASGLFELVGMNEIEAAAANQLPWRISEHPFDGWTGIG